MYLRRKSFRHYHGRYPAEEQPELIRLLSHYITRSRIPADQVIHLSIAYEGASYGLRILPDQLGIMPHDGGTVRPAIREYPIDELLLLTSPKIHHIAAGKKPPATPPDILPPTYPHCKIMLPLVHPGQFRCPDLGIRSQVGRPGERR